MTYLDVDKLFRSPIASALAAEPARSSLSDSFHSSTQPLQSEGREAGASRYTGRILQNSANLLGQVRAARQIEQPYYAGRSLLGRNNGFLGLAPGKMERADFVYVIAAMTVPCVIRRLPGGFYRFVGEFFVLDYARRGPVGFAGWINREDCACLNEQQT
jgi:hypothetical protein